MNMLLQNTFLQLVILTYLEIGICIGLQELGCAPGGDTAYSRRGPFRHVLLQCILWPLLFLVVKSTDLFEKIWKLCIVVGVLFFVQKYALPLAITQVGSLWALVPTLICGIIFCLGLFAFLRMPGFRPQF